jgi:hypothetical protein
MSKIAKNGNKAEVLFCNSQIVKTLLETYFGKLISKTNLVPGRKKSDVFIHFEDETKIAVQIKSGTGGGRGWSTDRRKITEYTEEEQLLLENVCLKKGTDRPEVVFSSDLIRTRFLGNDPEFQPQEFIHVIVKNNEISELSICNANAFLDALCITKYQNYLPKKTCVHLSPLLYLQRKGSQKHDKERANDIQLKLKKMPDCMAKLM